MKLKTGILLGKMTCRLLLITSGKSILLFSKINNIRKKGMPLFQCEGMHCVFPCLSARMLWDQAEKLGRMFFL
jgi:hypothetical protein